jgi:hypothetical protein
VVNVNAKSNASFSRGSVVGDMTKNDWSNAKFGHLRQCSSAKVMGSKMRNAKVVLVVIDSLGDLLSANARRAVADKVKGKA